MDYDELSSPDPLASSTISSSAYKPTARRKTTPAPVRKHNANKASIESISFLPTSSPSRTVTEQTLSPWKIRVTVEAEPEENTKVTEETVTKTIKVPLRREDSSAQTKGSRVSTSQSKPRRDSVSKSRRRSVTPVTERKRRQSVTDLDITVLGDDSEGDEWGKSPKKISPRKPRMKKEAVKQTATTAAQVQVLDFSVRQDTDVDEDGQVPLRDDSPELRQIDLNRVSMRTRANSTKEPQLDEEACHSEEESHRNMPRTHTGSMGKRTVSANSAMTYPTPSPTASERGRSVDVEEEDHEHPQGFDTIMESEGFTMIDLESIPSVKQMLSSPLENQETRSTEKSKSPAESDSTVLRHPSSSHVLPVEPQVQPLRALPPHIVLPEDESEISSTVPSSPPTFLSRPQITRQKTPLSHLQVPAQPRNRQVTPQPYSSPKLPSPPRQQAPKERLTPDSAKAMRAGLALQNAIEPVDLSAKMIATQKPTISTASHGRSSSGESLLFEGFDSSTQRELRAGLRFGEELAKKQAQNSKIRPTDISSAAVWRGESVISRTPVQVSLNSGQSNTGHITIQPNQESSTNSTPRSRALENGLDLDTDARRERQWQLEREAVSKQIENASPSKVIIIDSDDDDSHRGSEALSQEESGYDDTIDDAGDIWLEEAKDSSSSPHQEREEIVVHGSRESHQKQVRETNVEMPRRSQIPSPWKRGEQIEQGNNSTFMTSGDEFSGILWKQPQADDIRFGDIAIDNARRGIRKSDGTEFGTRRTSGLFDVEKMLGTPRVSTRNDKNENQKQADDSSRLASRTRGDIPAQQDVSEGETVEEEAMSESMQSDDSATSSEVHPQTIPVNFNDSTLSQTQITPLGARGPRRSHSPIRANHLTPRSAMKGARQSFGAALDGPDQAARKVFFAERSRGVNVEWIENSSSVHSSNEESEESISSPILEHQRHHEERNSIHVSSPQPEENAQPLAPTAHIVNEVEHPNQEQARKGWLGWIWNDKKNQTSSTPSPQIDRTSEPFQHQAQPEPEIETAWSKTSRHSGTTSQSTSHASNSQPRQIQLPSYLLPPSYPSDPTRPATAPLSTAGRFTNTHFRTLHILHRKSQRLRFHAPAFSSCRPDLRALVAKSWTLEVDESDASLGAFAWTLGELEARVLERFCQEVEFGVLMGRDADDERIARESFDEDQGIWAGNVRHGTGGVRWEWSVDQLATWLGRIVVGEVVRAEEFTG